MKRNELLRHLRRHGCYLKREGGAHSLWASHNTGYLRPFWRFASFVFFVVSRFTASFCRPS